MKMMLNVDEMTSSLFVQVIYGLFGLDISSVITSDISLISNITIYCSKTLSATKVEPIDHISTAESVSSHTQSEKNES